MGNNTKTTQVFVTEEEVSEALAKETFVLLQAAKKVDTELANTLREFFVVYDARVLATLFPEEGSEDAI